LFLQVSNEVLRFRGLKLWEALAVPADQIINEPGVSANEPTGDARIKLLRRPASLAGYKTTLEKIGGLELKSRRKLPVTALQLMLRGRLYFNPQYA
jgi:hypothetical protein